MSNADTHGRMSHGEPEEAHGTTVLVLRGRPVNGAFYNRGFFSLWIHTMNRWTRAAAGPSGNWPGRRVSVSGTNRLQRACRPELNMAGR